MLHCLFFAVVPKVEVSPQTVTKMQGSNVKAVCRASGSPRPDIRWNLGMLSTPNKVSQPNSKLLLSAVWVEIYKVFVFFWILV